jgi:DNA-binding transcriptional LysR family regulator
MYDWAEFRHFRYLLKILERGGFRVAAEELHTSQPNLTVQARQFQDYASISLFRKQKSGRIRPTETGVAFIALARMLLEVRDEVLDALIAIERGEIESVRFGATPLVDQKLFRTFCDLHRQILPRCSIRPTHGDPAQLVQEILAGLVDAAIVTLPVSHPDLYVEQMCKDRMVVCLPEESPLAAKAALQPADLDRHLTVLYHPQRHPDAHARLLELLSESGIIVEEYSRASHPSEMQTLVKEGYGFALIREGTVLEEGLTTRSVSGVDWTVDTAAIFRRNGHPRTVPIAVKMLKRGLKRENAKNCKSHTTVTKSKPMPRHPVQASTQLPAQMSFNDDSLWYDRAEPPSDKYSRSPDR